MKKKKIIFIIVVILLILLAGIIYLYLNSNTNNKNISSLSTNTIKEIEVGTQTITKTLTSSGEISSSEEETLELNTYRYFEEIYVEENDAVKEDDKILKYTNGTYLYAPYDCVITQINVPDSGYICRTSHYINIQTTEELVMTLNIDESEIKYILEGQEVTITVNAFEDKSYTGSILKINQMGAYDSSGSKFTAIVKLTNDGEIKLGMSASGEIILEKAENVIAIPIESIQTENSKKYAVIVNSDGTTENKEVETGLSNDAYVEIKSGLSGGEIIQMIEVISSNTNTGFNKGQSNEKMQFIGGTRESTKNVR